MALAVVIDQVSKYYVVHHFSLGISKPVAGNLLSITLWRNSGGAFGILPSMPLILTLISMATVIGVTAVICMYPESRYGFALSLLMGGTLGNLIDRLRFGYVIDFLDIAIWPIFNVADMAITAGVIIIAYYMIFGSRSKSRSHADGLSVY